MFQLETVKKTFNNDLLDEAYQTLTEESPKMEDVNRYVEMINFLDKDYLEDVEAIKKFANSITERVTKVISKTAMKVELLMRKMQDHIKEYDFNNFHEFTKNHKVKEEAEKS